MRKILLGIAALATASASQAAVTISFNSPTGDVGSAVHAYSSGGYTVTAEGCSNFNFSTNVCTTTHLFGKADGGDENGVGLVGDPSGNGEIWWVGGGVIPAILLDVSGILSAGSAQFTMGSTTAGEQWILRGWNGSSWTTLISNGTADGTAQALPGFGTYSVYAFLSGGTVSGDTRSAGNVLLGSIILPSVPEPATWGLMMLGFAGIGVAMRRRRRPAIAQVA
jgi:hypothetical protein